MSAASYRVVLRDLEQRRAVLTASLEQTTSAIAALTALLDEDDDADAETPGPAPKARPARPTRASSSTDLMGRVLATLSQGPLSLPEVAEAVGLPKETTRHQLSRLVDAGQVVREGKTSQTKYQQA